MNIPNRILERRRSARIAESFLFKIAHQGYDIQAVTVNVSSHGVMGIVETNIPVMSQIKVALQLPAKTQKGGAKVKTIQVKGVVVRKDRDVRTGRYLVAIYFSEMKPADQKCLERFIDRYLKTG